MARAARTATPGAASVAATVAERLHERVLRLSGRHFAAADESLDAATWSFAERTHAEPARGADDDATGATSGGAISGRVHAAVRRAAREPAGRCAAGHGAAADRTPIGTATSNGSRSADDTGAG